MQRIMIPAALVGLTLAMAAPTCLPLTSLGTSSYDPLDANLFIWNFWWIKQALGDLQSPYWTPLLLYPSGASLTFHSDPLVYGLASIPFQSLMPGIPGLVAAFNAIALASFVLTALGAYLLAVRLTRCREAGLLCGLIVALMPYRFLNVARLHLLATEFLVWFVFLWVTFNEAPTRTRAVLAGACLAATFYSSPEYAVAALLLCLLMAARRMWTRRPAFPSHAWSAGLVAIAVMAPLLVAQALSLQAGGVAPLRSLSEREAWSPALISLFIPNRLNPMWGHLFSGAGDYGTPGIVGVRSETAVGLAVWCLAAVGVSRMKRDGTAFWVAAAVGFVMLTLGPFLRLTGTVATSVPLPDLLLCIVFPPLRASRDPTRMFPMAMLMLSVLAAFGLRACLQVASRALTRMIITTGAVVVVLAEALMPLPAKIPAGELIPKAYGALAHGGAGAVLDLSSDQRALLAQVEHGRPLMSGRVAVPRAAVQDLTPVEQDLRNPEQALRAGAPDAEARIAADRRSLNQLGIGFVVFPAPDLALAALAARLGLSRVASDAVEVWRNEAKAGPAAPPPADRKGGAE